VSRICGKRIAEKFTDTGNRVFSEKRSEMTFFRKKEYNET